MVAIEDKISQFYEETEESVNEIIEGSDDHLDLILSLVTPLNKLSTKFADLNKSLLECLDEYSDDDIKIKLMPKMRNLNKSCMTLIGSMRSSFLYKDVREALRNYTRQHELLLEIMHDLQNVRLSNDRGFDNILNDLNAL